MAVIYIGLGSNLGDRLSFLQQACKEISKQNIRIIAKSPIYKTSAWGKTDQPDFLNQAIKIETNLKPPELVNLLQKIEVSVGRIHRQNWAEREIDLDVLFYDKEIINLPNVTIPHPGATLRKSVLIPLNDIAPQHIHPGNQKTIQEILNQCQDNTKIAQMSNVKTQN